MKNVMMKNFFSLIYAMFLLLSSTDAQAGLQQGIDAYEKGNYPAALEELKPLADQGNAVAQSILGLMYANGQGVPQDDKEAVAWYHKAAEQGEADAQTFLGAMYSKGKEVPQNYEKAATWYRKAADQGYAPAQFNLGVMYANGQGVSLDLVQAHMWFSLAEVTVGEQAADNRKLVEADMTPQQIEESHKLAHEWAEQHK